MGRLIEGVWRDEWYDTSASGGAFKREEATFRTWIRADGSTPFPPEADRYHLYVSYACPWAHRTLIVRALKGLEEAVGVTVVAPYMAENGWELRRDDGTTRDQVNGCDYLYQVYLQARPDMTGRVTVPVLWDKTTGTIVNNESSEILRMLNRELDAFATHPELDLCPDELLEEIEAINRKVYDHVNNGVYKCGFATSQAAYEEAFTALFSTLDELEALLARRRYLVGERITEADWRLFTTLVRFDAVYFGHFKCNRRRIVDYPNLWGYLRELYQVPGVRSTVHLDQIKEHYYRSHTTINPTQIVPLGPEIDFEAPHGRG